MIDSSESKDGSGGAGGVVVVEGSSWRQRMELARRKVANAAYYSAKNVMGYHDEDSGDVTATASNTSVSAPAAAVAAGVTTFSPLPPVPEMSATATTDEITDMSNNSCIQLERSSNSRDQFHRIENSRHQSNIIMLVSSMAVLGIAVVVQQQSPTSVFTAVFFFVLGYCADKILMHSFAFHHQRSTHNHCIFVSVDAGTQTLPSPSLSSESNPHTKIGSTAHYLEKTKQLLSQHNLLAVGGQNMNVRRYSNLLHSPSVVSVMATERTNRRRVTYDDKDDIIGEEEDAAIREWKRRRRAPFSEGPLMDHLLNYSDFHRLVKKSTKTTMNVMAKVVRSASARNESKSTEDDDIHWEQEEEEEEEEEEGACVEVGDTTTSGTILVGKAKLNNVRASRVFTHVVEPLCCLRGMDLFVTDTPEEEIWRQPMLNECGLRDVPTLIANMMLPFGNMTAYFKLPDWFDNWDNIPAEKIDDPPDIRAFKRFLSGDAEYMARAKVIPYVVDGPLAIRMIKPPKPKEVPIHTPRHPAKWIRIPKSVDHITGKTNCAIMECDVDCVSDNKMRKLISIVRPFMQSITIDMAFIIAKSDSSSIDGPCACLGLWRVDKVDFDSYAVFPDRTIDDVAAEMKLIMSVMEEQCK